MRHLALLLLCFVLPSREDVTTAFDHYRNVPIAHRVYLEKMQLYMDTTVKGNDWLTMLHSSHHYTRGWHFGALNGRPVLFYCDVASPDEDGPIKYFGE